jgi:hypothetical protein
MFYFLHRNRTRGSKTRATLTSVKQHVSTNESLLIVFLLGVCDPASKENVQNTPQYAASPFKALQGFVELETKQKRKEEMVKTAASSAQAAAAATKPTVAPLVQSSKSNDLPLPAQQKETDNRNSEFDNIVVPEEDQLFSEEEEEEDTSPKEAKLPLAKLRSLVFDHLLEIINSGNYEQLTSLKGIGKVRAMKIFTIRNAGSAFECVDDLEAVGMNNKQIEKFVKENVGLMLGNY